MANAVEWVSSTSFIDVRFDRDVAVIIINRPKKLNALTFDMRRELADAVETFGDRRDVRGLVITGSGRAFCAGEDLTEAASAPTGSIVEALKLFNNLTRAVLSTTRPVIAALNGIVVGGAAEWTLSFDARIGSENCEYYFPENRLGLPISNASSYLLPRITGAAAIDIVMSGRRVDADEALTLRLIDEVVSGDDVVAAAVERILTWTEGERLTQVHLELLRPPMADVEAAIAREEAAASVIGSNGLAIAGSGFRAS